MSEPSILILAVLFAIAYFIFWFVLLPLSLFSLLRSFSFLQGIVRPLGTEHPLVQLFIHLIAIKITFWLFILIFAIGTIFSGIRLTGIITYIIVGNIIYLAYRNYRRSKRETAVVIPPEYQKLVAMKKHRDQQIARDNINIIRRINKLQPLPPIDDKPDHLPFDDVDLIEDDDLNIHPIMKDKPNYRLTEFGGCFMVSFIIYMFFLLFAELANYLK